MPHFQVPCDPHCGGALDFVQGGCSCNLRILVLWHPRVSESELHIIKRCCACLSLSVLKSF